MPETKYIISIKRLVPNEKYEAQLKEDMEKRRYDRPYNNNGEREYPERYYTETTLSVELTQAQFEAVKKAAVEVM